MLEGITKNHTNKHQTFFKSKAANFYFIFTKNSIVFIYDYLNFQNLI